MQIDAPFPTRDEQALSNHLCAVMLCTEGNFRWSTCIVSATLWVLYVHKSIHIPPYLLCTNAAKKGIFPFRFFSFIALSGEMLGSSWENLHVVWWLQSTEASLSIKPVSFWSMQIYFDLVHAVLWAEMCAVGRHTVCVCVCVRMCFFVCSSGCDSTLEIWKQLILVLVIVALMHRIDFNKKGRRKKYNCMLSFNE